MSIRGAQMSTHKYTYMSIYLSIDDYTNTWVYLSIDEYTQAYISIIEYR